MKSMQNLLEQLKPLPHIDKNTVHQFGVQLGLTDSAIDTYISRLLRRKELHRLKNGLYVSADFFANNQNDIAYSFYLANILRAPSYISSWTALQYYNLVTEAIYPIISVTPKVTREYQTKAGTFTYQSINPALFADFSLISGSFDFFIATPAKALFDLLYFRTNQFRSIPRDIRMNKTKIKALVDELRIDLDEMELKEQKKFFNLLVHYE